MIDFVNLRENLNSNFYPLLIAKGKDEWVKSRAIAHITNSLDIEYLDMNIHHVDSGNIDDLMMICNTLPFFSNQKLVIVHSMDYGKGNELARTITMLNQYHSSSDNSCCLVLCVGSDDKSLDKVSGQTINCNKLSDKDVIKWITATVNRSNRTIDYSTASMIAQYCLSDMGRVASETDKLCIHATSSIDSSMVELLVTKDVEYMVFDLSKVIAGKKTALALDMLSTLMRQGNDARRLFSMLYNYYRRMYYIRISKCDKDTLATQLGVKTGAIGFAKDVANKYKPRQLLGALALFAEADTKLKNFANEQDTMQLLVLQLVAL